MGIFRVQHLLQLNTLFARIIIVWLFQINTQAAVIPRCVAIFDEKYMCGQK